MNWLIIELFVIKRQNNSKNRTIIFILRPKFIESSHCFVDKSRALLPAENLSESSKAIEAKKKLAKIQK